MQEELKKGERSMLERENLRGRRLSLCAELPAGPGTALGHHRRPSRVPFSSRARASHSYASCTCTHSHNDLRSCSSYSGAAMRVHRRRVSSAPGCTPALWAGRCWVGALSDSGGEGRGGGGDGQGGLAIHAHRLRLRRLSLWARLWVLCCPVPPCPHGPAGPSAAPCRAFPRKVGC